MKYVVVFVLNVIVVLQVSAQNLQTKANESFSVKGDTLLIKQDQLVDLIQLYEAINGTVNVNTHEFINLSVMIDKTFMNLPQWKQVELVLTERSCIDGDCGLSWRKLKLLLCNQSVTRYNSYGDLIAKKLVTPHKEYVLD